MSDARLSKQTVNRRKSRAAQNRVVTESREQTDAERLELFRQAHAEAILPNLPSIPGYHCVWLTSGNQKDTLSARERLGYVPIKPEELPGFGEFSVGQGGVVDGKVCVNEMVAYKLPLSLYQLYMRENHHDEPARQAEKLTDTVDSIKREVVRQRGRVEEGDGVEALREQASVPVPDFTEDG